NGKTQEIRLLSMKCEIVLEQCNMLMEDKDQNLIYKAKKLAETVYKREGSKIGSTSLLVNCRVMMGDFGGALEVVKRLAVKEQENPIILLLIAKVLVNNDECFEQTENLLRTVLSLTDSTTNDCESNTIRKRLGKGTGINVTKLSAANLLVDLYVNNERVEDAIMFLDDIAVDMNSDELFVKLGNVYVIADNFERAEICYNTAISINPYNKKAKDGLAKIGELEILQDDDTETNGEYDANMDDGAISEQANNMFGANTPVEMGFSLIGNTSPVLFIDGVVDTEEPVEDLILGQTEMQEGSPFSFSNRSGQGNTSAFAMMLRNTIDSDHSTPK
ncbi:hypothetical protein BB559_006698, partial [Furculomyces boomerangus]